MENPRKFVFVKGVPFISTLQQVKTIEKVEDELEVGDKDVILVTYPKSGTHWMIDILSLIISKGDPTWVKTVSALKRSPWIEYLNIHEVNKTKADPRLFTSHLPIQLFPKSFFTSKAKVIYLARNPRDIFVSLYHFQHQIPFFLSLSTFEHMFVEFLHGNVAYGSWFDHIKGWLSMRDSEKFLFLTYEELHQDLRVSVKKICQFLEKELSEKEISSILENASFEVMKKHRLKSNEPITIENREPFKMKVMRKGICGDWKNYFTVTQMETFNKMYQEKMKGLGQNLFPWD